MTKNSLVILVTGSRVIAHPPESERLARGLLAQETMWRGNENIAIIHGDAEGWDTMFQSVAERWPIMTHRYPAAWFNSPLERNLFMAKLTANYYRDFLGHDVVCWAFANKWASGTGHCARKAREFGISTIDYGVNTERKS